MSDSISRADAISVLEIFTQTDVLGHTPKQIVEALPSAQPEQRWIPCRERLPETINTYYLITTNRNEIDIGYWLVDEWQTFSDAEVTAWMPLPAPWKGEQPC